MHRRRVQWAAVSPHVDGEVLSVCPPMRTVKLLPGRNIVRQHKPLSLFGAWDQALTLLRHALPMPDAPHALRSQRCLCHNEMILLRHPAFFDPRLAVEARANAVSRLQSAQIKDVVPRSTLTAK
eukprot:CAMPEP_0174705530 /NCGR_PEP_ID=MMETSP1094-20130205/8725_1 /TAXON_ID=156173 /ORGANISM="Chrysochromulina brevifilum, Strain UTEX LB 985" /LENGTH=123 /DNA_ID=CAMNT_0015903707 /DNA_START=257 /DNA_END=628 /DNA_ORIENTATION=-